MPPTDPRVRFALLIGRIAYICKVTFEIKRFTVDRNSIRAFARPLFSSNRFAMQI